jgi:predicted aspartyl protease
MDENKFKNIIIILAIGLLLFEVFDMDFRYRFFHWRNLIKQLPMTLLIIALVISNRARKNKEHHD